MTYWDDGDSDLRQHFTDRREADAVQAPAFEAVVGRARAARALRRRRARIAGGSAAAAMAAVVAVCVGVRGPAPNREPVSIQMVVEWRATTDALLPTSLPTLFGPMTPLGASVVDSLVR